MSLLNQVDVYHIHQNYILGMFLIIPQQHKQNSLWPSHMVVFFVFIADIYSIIINIIQRYWVKIANWLPYHCNCPLRSHPGLPVQLWCFSINSYSEHSSLLHYFWSFQSRVFLHLNIRLPATSDVKFRSNPSHGLCSTCPDQYKLILKYMPGMSSKTSQLRPMICTVLQGQTKAVQGRRQGYWVVKCLYVSQTVKIFLIACITNITGITLNFHHTLLHNYTVFTTTFFWICRQD